MIKSLKQLRRVLFVLVHLSPSFKVGTLLYIPTQPKGLYKAKVHKESGFKPLSFNMLKLTQIMNHFPLGPIWRPCLCGAHRGSGEAGEKYAGCLPSKGRLTKAFVRAKGCSSPACVNGVCVYVVSVCVCV